MRKKLFKVTAAQALYNTRFKLYPTSNGRWVAVEAQTFTKQIFNPHKLELSKKFSPVEIDNKRFKSTEGNEKSKRRAIRKVYDYTMCNPDMNMFLTLTCNKEVVDRYSYKEVIKYLKDWLGNRVRRKGLKYILVPELHKDGAIHLHGFANREALMLKDSGHKRGGKTVWNIADLDMGFSTAIQISGVREHIAKYIVKYIVKATQKSKIGGRYYLSSNNLQGPRYAYYNYEYQHIEPEVEFECCEGVSVKIWNPDQVVAKPEIIFGQLQLWLERQQDIPI